MNILFYARTQTVKKRKTL